MNGKTCLITGATSGIGRVTARELAAMGAQVIIVGRNPQRCQETVDTIRQETGNREVDFLLADLSSQAQVRRIAEEFQKKVPSLNVLINNAGAVFMKRHTNLDGIEMTIALNHLSYFLLTSLLLECLKSSAPARIVNVASDANQGAKIDFDDLQGLHKYAGFRAYSQSKLANILFTFELAHRLDGSGVTANALHPGFVSSNLAKNNGPLVRSAMKIAHLWAISPEKGARTSVYLASSPEVEGVNGKYFVNEKETQASPEAYNQEVAHKLWEISIILAGGSLADKDIN